MVQLQTRKFYNAVEAYQMAKAIREQHEQIELEELFDHIDGYVKAGMCQCDISVLTDFQKSWLIENGYEIGEISGTNSWRDGMFIISWEPLL